MFPDRSTGADFDMNAARLSRRALIDKHADAGTLVLPQHFATRSSGAPSRAPAMHSASTSLRKLKSFRKSRMARMNDFPSLDATLSRIEK